MSIWEEISWAAQRYKERHVWFIVLFHATKSDGADLPIHYITLKSLYYRARLNLHYRSRWWKASEFLEWEEKKILHSSLISVICCLLCPLFSSCSTSPSYWGKAMLRLGARIVPRTRIPRVIYGKPGTELPNLVNWYPELVMTYLHLAPLPIRRSIVIASFRRTSTR